MWCAMCCSAMLCYALLAMQCYAMLWYAPAMLCYVTLCYAMLLAMLAQVPDTLQKRSKNKTPPSSSSLLPLLLI